MEFWGVEVKPGQPLKVEPGEGMVVHLSQAAIGESKKDKGSDSVFVYVKVGDEKLVLGSLSSGTIPQIQYDVVFEQAFELSHNWKNGSVYFCGYKAQNPGPDDSQFDDESDFDEEEESDEELAIENGKPEIKIEEAKPSSAKANAKVKVEPKAQVADPKAVEDDSDEDDSDEDDSEEEGSEEEDDSDDEDMMASDEEEETPTPKPKKPEAGKKRASEAVTPASTKKAKVATPQKTDGKKAGAHVATPHPAKQAGKTPASKGQTPKSAGSAVSCGTCSKTFNSEQALSSHTKAKHAAK